MLFLLGLGYCRASYGRQGKKTMFSHRLLCLLLESNWRCHPGLCAPEAGKPVLPRFVLPAVALFEEGDHLHNRAVGGHIRFRLFAEPHNGPVQDSDLG